MSLPNVVTSLGPVKAHVRPVAEEIANRWVLYFIWGAPGRGTGDHARGLALDFMTYEYGGGVDNPGRLRDDIGHAIAAYVLANRVRLNVAYIIWNRRIASAKRVSIGGRVYNPWEWRPYDGSNPHVDHVHVSFEEAGVYTPPPTPRPDPEDDVTPEQMEQIAQRAAELVWRRRLSDGNEATAADPEAATWLAGGMQKWDRQRQEMSQLIAGQTALAAAVQALTEKVDALTQPEEV